MMLWKLHLLSNMAFWGGIYWVLAKTLVHNEGWDSLAKQWWWFSHLLQGFGMLHSSLPITQTTAWASVSTWAVWTPVAALHKRIDLSTELSQIWSTGFLGRKGVFGAQWYVVEIHHSGRAVLVFFSSINGEAKGTPHCQHLRKGILNYHDPLIRP